MMRLVLAFGILAFSASAAQVRASNNQSVSGPLWDLLFGRKATTSLPLKKKFAVVTRGQAFRSWNKHSGRRNVCLDVARDSQLSWTATFVENVIEPLESTGNSIQIFVTSIECKFNSDLVDTLGGSKRVVKTNYFDSEGQGDNIRKALDTLNDEYGGADNIPNHFDYVLVARNDLKWHVPMDKLQNVSFENFNFFALSDHYNPNRGGWNVVLDTVHLMPARFYPTFNSVVGTNNCFIFPSGDGHPCYAALDEALKNVSSNGKIGFLSPNRYRVRGPTNSEVELPMPPTEPEGEEVEDATGMGEEKVVGKGRRALEGQVLENSEHGLEAATALSLDVCKSTCARDGYSCSRDSGCKLPSCQLACEIAISTDRAGCYSACEAAKGTCSHLPTGFAAANLCTSGACPGGLFNGNCEDENGCHHACDLMLPKATTTNCSAGSTHRKGPYLKVSNANSATACQAMCESISGSVAFDYTTEPLSNSCRCVGSGQSPRIGKGGRHSRKYCILPGTINAGNYVNTSAE